MKKTFNILYFILLTTIFSFAQTGPGGVGDAKSNSNLIMWFRTDNGLVASSNDVTEWRNSANYTAHDLSKNGTLGISLEATNLNGYQQITFNSNGLNGALIATDDLNSSNFVSTESSSFTVLKTITEKQSIAFGTTAGNDSSQRFSSHIPWSNSRVYFDVSNPTSTGGRIFTNELTGFNNYSIWTNTAKSAPITSTSKWIYRDGTLITSAAGTYSFTDYATRRFKIGDNSNFTLPELIIYKTKVNEAQRIIIDNYLSAKYNITIGSNDFYTQDNAGNGNYDHDVAGIGQASDGSNHSDSQGTGIVRMSNPSNLSNNKFLFWGEETKDPTYNFTTNTTNYIEHLNSKWRVNKVNDLGTVNVSFDISAINLTGKQSCRPLQLVVANNSNFTTPTAYNLTISGNNATATNVQFANGNYFTLRYVDQIVWDGITTYFNGSGPANAPNTADACLKLTVKAGTTAILTANAHVREILVETGAKLQVNNGLLLEVEKEIVNNGTIELIGEAQLIQNHTGASTNSGIGRLKIRQEGTTNFYNYNYWSSPVNRGGNWQASFLETEAGPVGFTGAYNANPSASPMELSRYWLYSFNGTSGQYYQWSYLGENGTLAPGLGYTMKGSGNTSSPSGQTYVFSGTANSGYYSIAAASGNDILIGNPYPSALSSKQFITDNINVIDGTLYFYEQFETNNTHNTADYQGGYATYNLMMGVGNANAAPDTNGGTSTKGAPKDNIAVAQGFFVTIDTNGSIEFKNSQRTFAKESSGEATFYRSSEQPITTDNRIKFWLDFNAENIRPTTIGLGYDENASADYDKAYDGRKYNSTPNEIYWTIPNEKLAIQALNTFNITNEMSIGVKITTAGNFTFKISDTENFPEDVTIYLKDEETNSYYNIKTAPVTLTLASGEYQSRFSVVYQEGETLSSTDFDSEITSAYYNMENDTLVLEAVDSLQEIKSITVYNILGQEVAQFKAIENKNVSLLLKSTGVYIAKILSENGTVLNLKFVKR